MFESAVPISLPLKSDPLGYRKPGAGCAYMEYRAGSARHVKNSHHTSSRGL